MEGKLNWSTIERAGRSTVRQTSMILFIVIGAKIISLLFIQYRVSTTLVAWIAGSGTSATTVQIVLCLLYLMLGMFFEGVSMMVITVPFVVPLMVSLNVDLVWLGVLICIMIEVSLITPPVGVNLYVLQGATGEPLRDIIVGSAPFVVIQLLMVPLLFLLPWLALYLPSRLF
jgi:TRAP-type C4-dicarboxylate transport system permease large subunit